MRLSLCLRLGAVIGLLDSSMPRNSLHNPLSEINEGVSAANSPSVDRIVPELGYVKGNVQIISHKANTIKSNATLEDLKLMVEHMERIA